MSGLVLRQYGLNRRVVNTRVEGDRLLGVGSIRSAARCQEQKLEQGRKPDGPPSARHHIVTVYRCDSRSAPSFDLSGCHSCWERLVEASVVFGVGQGPVDAMVISDTGEPSEGLPSVVSSAERILVGSGGGAVRVRLVMIKVAAICRYGAGREAAGSGPEVERRVNDQDKALPSRDGHVAQPTGPATRVSHEMRASPSILF
jgi:hypothetical protein